MRHVISTAAALAATAALALPALAQTPPPPPAPPAHHGILGHLFHRPGATAASGQRPTPSGMMHPGMTHPGMMRPGGMTSPISGGIIGNKNSHVYHLPSDKSALPAAQNRVYFHSAAEAEAAGYHQAGGGKGMTHHSASMMHGSHAPAMTTTH